MPKTRSAKLCLRSKKKPFVPRMRLTRRSKSVEMKFSVTSVVLCRRKENLDKKLESIEKREASFRAKEEDLKKQKVEIAKPQRTARTGTGKNFRINL